MKPADAKVTERPCQGCNKPLRVEPPFTGREAVWACLDCLRAEHEALVSLARKRRGGS